MKSNRDSEIKARYALAVLRVAQVADRPTSVRLVQGLARDLPHPDERRETAVLHFEAIEAFEKLAECQVALVTSSSWRAPADIATKWLLSAVERS